MLLKIKSCCALSRVVKKNLILNPTFEDGEPSHIFRVLCYIDKVLIRFCPQCGHEVEIEVNE